MLAPLKVGRTMAGGQASVQPGGAPGALRFLPYLLLWAVRSRLFDPDYPRVVIGGSERDLLFKGNGQAWKPRKICTAHPQPVADMVESIEADNHILMT